MQQIRRPHSETSLTFKHCSLTQTNSHLWSREIAAIAQFCALWLNMCLAENFWMRPCLFQSYLSFTNMLFVSLLAHLHPDALACLPDTTLDILWHCASLRLVQQKSCLWQSRSYEGSQSQCLANPPAQKLSGCTSEQEKGKFCFFENQPSLQVASFSVHKRGRRGPKCSVNR